MAELYLILHKVRGEPAYDVAQRLEAEGETMWIIPTSGWRAYPLEYEELQEMVFLDPNLKAKFASLRDHYECEKPKPSTSIDLIDLLGLVPKIKRRI